MWTFIRRAWAVKRQVEQNVNGVAKAKRAYGEDGTLPDVIRAWTMLTATKADDQVDEAALVLLGELRQATYNSTKTLKTNAEALRQMAALMDGLAAQGEALGEFLRCASEQPLKQLLEE